MIRGTVLKMWFYYIYVNNPNNKMNMNFLKKFYPYILKNFSGAKVSFTYRIFTFLENNSIFLPYAPQKDCRFLLRHEQSSFI